jgi:hypothetical protein
VHPKVQNLFLMMGLVDWPLSEKKVQNGNNQDRNLIYWLSFGPPI